MFFHYQYVQLGLVVCPASIDGPVDGEISPEYIFQEAEETSVNDEQRLLGFLSLK